MILSEMRKINLKSDLCGHLAGQRKTRVDTILPFTILPLKKGTKIPSTYGKPKVIGEYKSKRIEIMRNIITGEDNINIKNFIASKKSKRWPMIRRNPIIVIYPKIEIFNDFF